MLGFLMFMLTALFPFTAGFVLTGLWRRWWMLLIAAAIALYMGLSAYTGASTADGPGFPLGILLAWFFVLGSVTGIFASGTVVAGRMTGSKTLRPSLVIPVVLAIGFGGPMAFYGMHAISRAVRMSAPARSCFARSFPVTIGGVALSIPAAPGITLYEDKTNRTFGMWHNPDLKDLCARAPGEALPVWNLQFMLHESFWSTHEAKDAFCAVKHPEYPWADWVCDPKAGRLTMPGKPGFVRISVPRWPNPASKPPPALPARTLQDGSTVYGSGDDLVIILSNGDRVECGRSGRDVDMQCGGDGVLPDGLAIYYSFWAPVDGIERTAPIMATAARSYLDSIRRR